MTARSAAELRAAFDGAFAEAPLAIVPHVDVIAIRAGGEPCAFARTDIAALRTDLDIVALPTRSPSLLGVAQHRGNVIPIWDLGWVLHGVHTRPARWCAVLRDETRAVAFDGFAAHVRAPAPLGAMLEHGGEIYRVLELARELANDKGAAYGR